MFCLNLIDVKVASMIEMIREIIIIKNVFLITFVIRVKVVLNILN